MNLKNLQREIEHLEVLLAIKARDDDEERLATALLFILSEYLDDKDATVFRKAFSDRLYSAFQGLYPDESFDDLIQAEVDEQAKYLDGFIEALEQEKVSPAMARARTRMYATSLGKLREQINLERAGDRLLTWKYNHESLHCGSCLGLNGQSKPASEWRRLGLYPKSPLLECSQSCNCNFF